MAYYTYSAPTSGTSDAQAKLGYVPTPTTYTPPTSLTVPTVPTTSTTTLVQPVSGEVRPTSALVYGYPSTNQPMPIVAAPRTFGIDTTGLPTFYPPYTWDGSGGGGGGSTYWQDRDDARAGAQAQLDYLNRLIRANRAQYGSLVGNLGSAFNASRTAAQNQYAAALAALQGRRTEATTLAGQGQQALADYLASNVPSAFAQLPQATGPTLEPDVVSQYAQAIGTPTAPIGEAAVRAATEYAGGSDAYNRLLSNLQASEANTQASRLAELEMLKNVQNAQIQQLYGGGATTLEQQRLAALNALAQEQAQQRYVIDQQRIAREQAIQQALAQVYGTGYVPFNPATFFSTSGAF